MKQPLSVVSINEYFFFSINLPFEKPRVVLKSGPKSPERDMLCLCY